MNVTDVFIFSGGYDDRLKQCVKVIHNWGMKAHLCIDCFSSSEPENLSRVENIIKEIRHAKEKYEIDGINLDAIRYWQPRAYDNMGYREDSPKFDNTAINNKRLIKDWVKFIWAKGGLLNSWKNRCELITSTINYIKYELLDLKIIISACLKCEYQNYRIAKWFAKLYGQDYKLISKQVNIMMPMTYKNAYRYGWFNKNYDSAKLSKEMNEFNTKVTPIIQAYYFKGEHNNIRRMPTLTELQKEIDDNKGNSCLFLYEDMKTKNKELLKVRL